MNSPTKKPVDQETTLDLSKYPAGKFLHSCDEDMSDSEQIEMIEHDIEIRVAQLVELAGPSYTRDKLQAAANDLTHESLEEENEKLMQRVGKLGVQVLDLEKDKQELLSFQTLLENENQQLKDRLAGK